ncbi:MAG: AI-2E family transporter [Clostridiales bacterium]|nr:AI-2E family transporter [Clostridiales bacterium]
MELFRRINRRTWTAAALATATIVVLVAFGRQAALVLRLSLGGAVFAFVLSPLCDLYARRMRRGWAVALSYLTVLLALSAVVLVLVPVLAAQLRQVAQSIPRVAASVEQWADQANRWLAERRLPEVRLSGFSWQSAAGDLGGFLDRTATMAGAAVGAITELGMMLLLSYYFLRDKDRLLLHMELLIPVRARRVVLRMGSAIRHELGVYLRGQLTIALAVGSLTALGLMLAGVDAFLVMGMLIGVLNMIPYFGPVLGGVPTMLMALAQGWGVALGALVVLVAVQQVDGWLISPRVMGAVTGLHPALVLLALMSGGSLAGAWGMLFAVPLLLVIRASARIWMARYEKV